MGLWFFWLLIVGFNRCHTFESVSRADESTGGVRHSILICCVLPSSQSSQVVSIIPPFTTSSSCLCSSADHKNMFGACHRFAVSLPEFRQVTPLSCPSQSGAHLTALRSSSPLSSHLKWLTHSCQLGSRRVGARSEQPFSTSTIATRGASPMHANCIMSLHTAVFRLMTGVTTVWSISAVLKHIRSRSTMF